MGHGLTGWQRVASMGAGMLVPGGGILARVGFNYMNGRNNGNHYTGQPGINSPNVSYSNTGDLSQNIAPTYSGNLSQSPYTQSPYTQQPSAGQPSAGQPSTGQPPQQPSIGASHMAPPVNQNGRTPAQEAAYAAQLQFQSQMAIDRYSQDIGFTNPFAGREQQ